MIGEIITCCEHRFDNPKIPKYGGVGGEGYVYVNYYEQRPPYEYLHDLKKDPNQNITKCLKK